MRDRVPHRAAGVATSQQAWIVLVAAPVFGAGYGLAMVLWVLLETTAAVCALCTAVAARGIRRTGPPTS